MVTYSAATPQQFFDTLPQETDVVIIGGGVIGICTAYYLAKKGVKVTVCEKGRVAGEQSSRNWGWVRQQGRDAAELPIAIESNRLWREITEEIGEDLGFRQHGVYYLAESDEDVQAHEAFMKLAREHQLDTRLLTAGEILEQIPGKPGRWRSGMVTPSDGRAEPWVVVPAIARAAQRMGVKVVENCAVRTVEITNGAVTGVVTEQGAVKANRILLAGGAWSSLFAANLGLGIPQLNVRATVAATEAVPDIFSGNAADSNFAFRRREDGGYTVAVTDIHNHYLGKDSFKYLFTWLPTYKVTMGDVTLNPLQPKGFPDAFGTKRSWSGSEISPFEQMRVLNPEPNRKAIEQMEKRLPDRFPQLAGTKLKETWAGMIDSMPDMVPVMDEVSKVKGFFIATGFSGHGFGFGPGAGRVLADMMEGRETGYNMSRFRFARFSKNEKLELGPFI
ncbi:FAD-binding oxidoreductase [Rhodobacteraceae bacterium RKSG542]|uniref:NAD(P)/FAD-dependent oxidoreductase n=1 Tax=Pseudovibrio flavus TaxID=2529854 RepID=UPI0012BBF7AB|nr:FAD-binding oxidoreductase [Pseudovibrio flavus]MTI17018.1 FAD-binding oxidoreductase [Pseudovibrio flavus]